MPNNQACKSDSKQKLKSDNNNNIEFLLTHTYKNIRFKKDLFKIIKLQDIKINNFVYLYFDHNDNCNDYHYTIGSITGIIIIILTRKKLYLEFKQNTQIDFNSDDTNSSLYLEFDYGYDNYNIFVTPIELETIRDIKNIVISKDKYSAVDCFILNISYNDDKSYSITTNVEPGIIKDFNNVLKCICEKNNIDNKINKKYKNSIATIKAYHNYYLDIIKNIKEVFYRLQSDNSVEYKQLSQIIFKSEELYKYLYNIYDVIFDINNGKTIIPNISYEYLANITSQLVSNINLFGRKDLVHETINIKDLKYILDTILYNNVKIKYNIKNIISNIYSELYNKLSK